MRRARGLDDDTGRRGPSDSGKDSTTNGVLFTSGSAQIDVTTDTLATLVAYDLMHNSGETLSVAGSRAGVLHKQWKVSTSAVHKGYQETQVADFQGSMGDARLSEWTAAGNVFGLGGTVHGYRASLTGGRAYGRGRLLLLRSGLARTQAGLPARHRQRLRRRDSDPTRRRARAWGGSDARAAVGGESARAWGVRAAPSARSAP